MYEIEIESFIIKREDIIQEFTLEDYNFKKELFMSDFIDYISVEVVTNLSATIYHNRAIKHLEIT